MRLLRAALVTLIVMLSLTTVAFEPVEGTEVMIFDRSGQTLLGYGRILGSVLRLELSGMQEGDSVPELLIVVASPEGEVLTLPAALTLEGVLTVETDESEPVPLELLLADEAVALEVFLVPRPIIADGEPGESGDDPGADDGAEAAGAVGEEASAAAAPAEAAGGGQGVLPNPAASGKHGPPDAPGQQRRDTPADETRGPPDEAGPEPSRRPTAPPAAPPAATPAAPPAAPAAPGNSEAGGKPAGERPGNSVDKSAGDTVTVPYGPKSDDESQTAPVGPQGEQDEDKAAD